MDNSTLSHRKYVTRQVASAAVVTELKYPRRVGNEPAFPQVVVHAGEVPGLVSSVPVEQFRLLQKMLRVSGIGIPAFIVFRER